MVSRCEQPISSKIARDCKHTELLVYDTNFESVRKRSVMGVPNFRKQMPRKTFLPGQIMGTMDPSGHGFIEETYRGLEGQNFGMASYKKGVG